MAVLPPPPLKAPSGSYQWLDWYSKLTNYLSQGGSVPWNVINFTGSNITSIATRNHNDLQSIQGGASNQFYHLTLAQYNTLPGTVNANANTVYAGPASGVPANPSFRSLITNDIPGTLTISGGSIDGTPIGNTSTSTGKFSSLTLGSTTLLSTSIALSNGAAAQTATLTNSPLAGNPTKWISINDNGTTRFIPAW